MRNRTLRYCSTLTTLLGPLLLLSCHDDVSVCSAQTDANGTTGTLCKTVNDVGQSTLALRTAEPAGDHCPYGGDRIDTGFDLNGNLQLDDSEIDITAYVCN